MIDAKPRFTHYSYNCGPNYIREPTGLYQLTDMTIEANRILIHTLMSNGELLAQVPFACEVYNMKDLRNVLEWIERDKRKKDDNKN